jgi:hypothetical protein
MSVVVEGLTGTISVAGYATVIDNVSGDAMLNAGGAGTVRGGSRSRAPAKS